MMGLTMAIAMARGTMELKMAIAMGYDGTDNCNGLWYYGIDNGDCNGVRWD